MPWCVRTCLDPVQHVPSYFEHAEVDQNSRSACLHKVSWNFHVCHTGVLDMYCVFHNPINFLTFFMGIINDLHFTILFVSNSVIFMLVLKSQCLEKALMNILDLTLLKTNHLLSFNFLVFFWYLIYFYGANVNVLTLILAIILSASTMLTIISRDCLSG